MEGAGVEAGGDNGIVGEMAAAADEFVGEFGLDFHFVDAGFDEVANAAEAGLGDVAGLSEEGDFEFGFDGAQPVHEGGQPLVFV